MATKSLDQIMKDLNKKYGNFVQEDASNVRISVAEKIPFTSPQLNFMCYGGLPLGTIVEFSGDEGGGKTTTSLDIMANAQKLYPDRKILFVDCEHSFDAEWAEKIGVDTSEIIIMQPELQYAEEILEAIENLISTGEFVLCILDSIPAMSSKQEFEKSIEEKTYAGIAMPLTVFSRKMVQVCGRTNCLLIGINQKREDLNNPHNQDKTPGGKGWKFFCSTRMAFRQGNPFDQTGAELKLSAEEAAGNRVDVTLLKAKSFPKKRRKASYMLNYDYGIEDIPDTVDLAIKMDIIKQGGAWFTFIDPESGEVVEDDGAPIKIQGKLNLIDYLRNDEIMKRFVEEALQAKIQED